MNKSIKLDQIQKILNIDNQDKVCTKKQLIELFSKIRNCTQKDGAEIIEDVLFAIETILQHSNSHKLNIREWATFSITHNLQPRTYRNPKTGAIIVKQSTHKLNFKPGKLLKDIVINLSSNKL
jgi:nucleoid DNA-binding protein